MDDITNWAKQFSKNTWERLEFISNYQSARLHETTITDDLVYNIYKKIVIKSSNINLVPAKNERANGNDLLIEFNYPDSKPLIFPIQAKRIYGKFKYPRMSHKGQLDSLLSYAEKIEGTPLYLLYNYFPNQFPTNEQNPGASIIKEQYGCTLVRADYIKTNFAHNRKRNNEYVWRIPDFTSLHPNHALPWHLLFENPHYFFNGSESKKDKLLLNSSEYKEKQEEQSWEPVSSDFLPAKTVPGSIKLYQEDSNIFLPRFKIVINLK